jgi:hypothetical protein
VKNENVRFRENRTLQLSGVVVLFFRNMLGTLVDELLLAVLAHVAPCDLTSVSLVFISSCEFASLSLPTPGHCAKGGAQVSKKMSTLAQDQRLWQAKYREEFGAWVPAAQCQESTLITWKRKYWLEHNLVWARHTQHTNQPSLLFPKTSGSDFSPRAQRTA